MPSASRLPGSVLPTLPQSPFGLVASPSDALPSTDRAPMMQRAGMGSRLDEMGDKPRYRWSAAGVKPVNVQARLKSEMHIHLEDVAHEIELHYGPLDYKADRYGFTIAGELAKAKKRVDATQPIRLSDYHVILRDFLRATRDYHVGLSVAQTASASLPLSIAPADGKYVIAYIDREKLGREVFPFSEGDEIVGFDGKPIGDVVDALMARFPENKPLTDRARACAALTSRNGSVGDTIPDAVSIDITVRTGGKFTTRQLAWTKTDERYVTGAPEASGPDPVLARAIRHNNWMRAADGDDLIDAENPYARGGRTSFVPTLGPVVLPPDPNSPFHAYIYKHASGKLVGVIRIETYSPKDPAANAAAFAKIIKHFESVTDGLVIDQVNNGGGSVAYSRAILSCLSPTAMVTPKRTMTIATDDVVEADEVIQKLRAVRSDADAKKALGDTVDGYPVTYDYVKKQLEFSRFIKSEYAAGKRLSAPFFLEGIDAVNPSPVAAYTKAIMILVNESAYSSADAVPAILQDNQRALVFGTESAGAGGSVRRMSISNTLGVVSFTLTANISYRPGGKAIENNGVTPDVAYALTAADYRTSCKPYAERVNAEIGRIMGS